MPLLPQFLTNVFKTSFNGFRMFSLITNHFLCLLLSKALALQDDKIAPPCEPPAMSIDDTSQVRCSSSVKRKLFVQEPRPIYERSL